MTIQPKTITTLMPDGVNALIVFDEVCVLCTGFARFITQFDRKQRLHFTSAQGPLGQALYDALGLPRDDFETNLVIIDGRVHTKMRAFIAAMETMGGIWRVAGVLRLLPNPVADWLYDRIARNRYRTFGKYDTCPVPSDAVKARLI
ncbi:MAG: DCC1-like thiol-disulfide oxidoreductase family protein [Pseudomonadota bacterium]